VPFAVIEVKRRGEIGDRPILEDINQAFDYCGVLETTRFVVITDGLKWFIYDRCMDAPRHDRLFGIYDFDTNDLPEKERLWELLHALMRRDCAARFLIQVVRPDLHLPEAAPINGEHVHNQATRLWEQMEAQCNGNFQADGQENAWSIWRIEGIGNAPRFLRVALHQRLNQVEIRVTKRYGPYVELQQFLVGARWAQAQASLLAYPPNDCHIVGDVNLQGRPTSAGFIVDYTPDLSILSRRTIGVMNAIRSAIL
jgi:hypothetical protein